MTGMRVEKAIFSETNGSGMNKATNRVAAMVATIVAGFQPRRYATNIAVEITPPTKVIPMLLGLAPLNACEIVKSNALTIMIPRIAMVLRCSLIMLFLTGVPESANA
ncbi:MAG: hypothetical protein Fur005_16370 [Roseiflexaceae bacterium]